MYSAITESVSSNLARGCCHPCRYKADYTKYEPYIVPLKSNPKQLYCTLTETELNRIPSEVEAHVNGRRFKIRKEMENSKQTTTTPTTSKEGFWVRAKVSSFS